jgi:hypothetical protein
VIAIPDQLTSPEWLAVAVTAVTLMIIVLSLAGSVMDHQIRAKHRSTASRVLPSRSKLAWENPAT